MADQKKAADKPKLMRVIEAPFEGDQAPPELSVGIVSLVELCDLAMPDPTALTHAIENAGFTEAPQNLADQHGGWLALNDKVFSFPVRNVRHRLWGRERHDAPVRLLLSEGDSSEGPVVFVSAFFTDAIEADAIKAAAHVSKKQPLTGATTVNADGVQLRRVFWDVEGASGIRGLMVTGPQNVEALGGRAITAFNLVSGRTA
jgi:hypothetical protein